MKINLEGYYLNDIEKRVVMTFVSLHSKAERFNYYLWYLIGSFWPRHFKVRDK